jgi:hypothetical protein
MDLHDVRDAIDAHPPLPWGVTTCNRGGLEQTRPRLPPVRCRRLERRAVIGLRASTIVRTRTLGPLTPCGNLGAVLAIVAVRLPLQHSPRLG